MRPIAILMTAVIGLGCDVGDQPESAAKPSRTLGQGDQLKGEFHAEDLLLDEEGDVRAVLGWLQFPFPEGIIEADVVKLSGKVTVRRKDGGIAGVSWIEQSIGKTEMGIRHYWLVLPHEHRNLVREEEIEPGMTLPAELLIEDIELHVVRTN